ncbi:DNA glycosylase [Gloeophyllum trabeum ATCC 11539]|uniref:DNA glycosylase n=1 Tax=Gloeophyllum trabeum (strain ATCC 11539 / FP-39264 / Madison 617) TaxID=670483 RepID=S7QG47_GLOTA|nr:DNA glycosylase [Gloeophyllum trabeum ATCC 11539]EPQ58133.1 DNA glycosylase [Gloeophyllum trabeum ATCC 11539]
MKRTRSPSVKLGPPDSPHKFKKLKLLDSYAADSPFPDYPHPTPEEAAEVHVILSKHHPHRQSERKTPSAANNSAQTCGGVPNVIESLIGTILSQNTSSRNSTAAKKKLDEAFGRNNFARIASAPRPEVVAALKTGGLANKKAATIQKLLASIKDKHGDYTLQHLAQKGVPDDEIMKELVSFDGVGPKTASCVLLFCLGRDSFAVDTHVYRLSRLLGWVPQKADRVLAQAHLDLRIPDELKYGLHVLMVTHGRQCPGCKNQGKGPCPLKTYLKERRGVKDEELDEKVREADQEVKEEYPESTVHGQDVR